MMQETWAAKALIWPMLAQVLACIEYCPYHDQIWPDKKV
jgi:hypothetical protein